MIRMTQCHSLPSPNFETFLTTCVTQICPSVLYTPSTTVLACLAGQDGECYENLQDALDDDGNVGGVVVFGLDTLVDPATFVIEIECCPIDIPGYTPPDDGRRLRG